MKIANLLALALALTSTASYAAPISCAVGELGQDNRFEVTFNLSEPAEVKFNPHEASFSATGAEVVRNGNSISILDRDLKGYAEGEEFTAKVNALLVYDPASHSVNLTLLMDGEANWAASRIQCQ